MPCTLSSLVLFTAFLSGTVVYVSAVPSTFISSLARSLSNSISAALPQQSTPSISPTPSPVILPLQRFPKNLHRLYDGTWEVNSNSPFNFIPPVSEQPTTSPTSTPSIVPPNEQRNKSQKRTQQQQQQHYQHTETINYDNNDSLFKFIKSASLSINKYLQQKQKNTNNLFSSSSSSPSSRISNISFQKKTGFALLTIDNRQSSLSSNLNTVFGDLILRDGAYRTQRDVSLHLTGLYELSTGKLILAGDIMYESSSNVLSRLYKSFMKMKPKNISTTISSTDNNTFIYYNTTENEFIDALSPGLEKYRTRYRPTRASDPNVAGIAAQCPFSASFGITPGNFDDVEPSETTDYLGGFGIGMNIDNTINKNAHNNYGHNYNNNNNNNSSFISSRGPTIFSTRSTNSFDDGLNAQDEFVEMKGKFRSETCKTEMSIVLATLDTERLFGKAINYTLLVTVVAFIQVIVLIKQMEMTSTQAGARRVSLMTVGLQAVADSYLCLGHLTMGIAVQTLFNAFATAAFFKFICFSIFLMRWMLLIWKARRPSGFSEGWEAMRRELSMLYSRFYGALLLGIFLLYQLQNHIRLFVFALYSFWLPQIILNAIEDHRRPLLPIYIIATSITRLAIPLYFWGCPYNFLHIEPQPIVALSLVSWIFIQAIMLLSQYKFGPRWFIPKEFLPEKYDYFRHVAIEDDEVIDLENCENGASRPLVSSVDHSEIRRECCICMESVAIHSRDRMVTPCNHFFHAACLERWLEVRLECALCRSPVPPP